jgi:hypothetical protein
VLRNYIEEKLDIIPFSNSLPTHAYIRFTNKTPPPAPGTPISEGEMSKSIDLYEKLNFSKDLIQVYNFCTSAGYHD